mmetsp:Transcript_19604/g.47067  ORF Transcript_19604/g.47067 Transcript_19604/m.47067 type:complete len:296 (+) Transcript_19604:116-1003(+)
MYARDFPLPIPSPLFLSPCSLYLYSYDIKIAAALFPINLYIRRHGYNEHDMKIHLSYNPYARRHRHSSRGNYASWDSRDDSHASHPPVPEQHPHPRPHVLRPLRELEPYPRPAPRPEHYPLRIPPGPATRRQSECGDVVHDLDVTRERRLPHVQNVHVRLIALPYRRALSLEDADFRVELARARGIRAHYDHAPAELLARFLVEGEGEGGRLSRRDAGRVDPGDVGRLGDSLEEGAVVGGAYVDLGLGTDRELSGVDESRNHAADTRYVREDVLHEKLERTIDLLLVPSPLGQPE